jgi:hypothetical protein
VSLDNLSGVETGLQAVQKTVDKYTDEVKSQCGTATAISNQEQLAV